MKKYLPFLFFLSIITPVSAQNDKTDVLQSLEQGQGQQQQPQQSTTATLKSAARLFGAKDDLTTVIMIIPSGSTVTILESDSTYYLVNYEDAEGYIFKRQAVPDRATVASRNNNNAVNTQVPQTRPVETSKVSRFLYLENKYGTSVAARINSGKIWKGMSPDMVKDSWGNPQKISRVINGNTVKEEWTYSNTRLSFQNNTLINWGALKQ